MTDQPQSGAALYARRMKTTELNRLLTPEAEMELHRDDPELLRAVQDEKDRRLADPNSPDFRPQFN